MKQASSKDKLAEAKPRDPPGQRRAELSGFQAMGVYDLKIGLGPFIISTLGLCDQRQKIKDKPSSKSHGRVSGLSLESALFSPESEFQEIGWDKLELALTLFVLRCWAEPSLDSKHSQR